MGRAETTVGGSGHEFPETSWSLISCISAPNETDRKTGLEGLCRRYWKPIYLYIRAGWAKSNDEAKDLTQAFFVWLLEGNALAHYQPDRGGFRQYLKTVLRHFVGDQERANHRLKRGGGRVRIPLDGDADSLESILCDSTTPTPDHVFDRMWMSEVARRALERVRDRLHSEGRAVLWQVFEAYDLAAGTEQPTYVDVAQKLGLRPADVRQHLFSVRQRVRSEIRQELRDTVRDESELESEWKAFFDT